MVRYIRNAFDAQHPRYLETTHKTIQTRQGPLEGRVDRRGARRPAKERDI